MNDVASSLVGACDLFGLQFEVAVAAAGGVDAGLEAVVGPLSRR